MAKKRIELTLPQRLAKLKHAGVEGSRMISTNSPEWEPMDSLEERVKQLLGIVSKAKVTDMLFFVMYDIESNKVRQQIAKYLLKMGCFRVQRSIFLAELDPEKYERIRSDLTEVQSYYDNHDSILIVPVSTELIKSMKTSTIYRPFMT